MSGEAPRSGVGVEGEKWRPLLTRDRRDTHFQTLSDQPFPFLTSLQKPLFTQSDSHFIMEYFTSRGLTPPALPCFLLTVWSNPVNHQPHLLGITASSQGNVGVPFPTVVQRKLLFRFWTLLGPMYCESAL